MEMLEHIKARRTIRKFKADPLPQDVLDQIYEAAMWAPSHGNAQPWDFAVIGPETRQKLLGLFKGKAKELLADPDIPPMKRKNIETLTDDFGGAPYMVAIVSRPGEDPLSKLENPLSAAVAAQNMSLAAWDKGVGSVWLSVGAAPPARPLFDVPEGASVVALLALGYPADVPPAPPREDYKARLRELP